jgi:ADP-ribosylglycohydrolase
MSRTAIERNRIEQAWQGRISGCQLGKPVELLSMTQGRAKLSAYLEQAGAVPLRDYVPLVEDAEGGALVGRMGRASCRGILCRSEPDDDITYSVLALMMLEEHGAELTTADVARAWLRLLPAAATFTAERAAYRTLLSRASEHFCFGSEPGFDLAECADNPYSDWIGAQIRADVYGWVCPGRPELAAQLAQQDAALSHREDGIHGAVFVAALGAAIPVAKSLDAAVDVAAHQIPQDSGAADAVAFGRSIVGHSDAVDRLHARYADVSPVHTLNNLALVVWSLLSGAGDFSAAIGDAVAAGWDTDCNGATVGALWGLSGDSIPRHWTEPWQGRVATSLAGIGELALADLVDRTVSVAESLAG